MSDDYQPVSCQLHSEIELHAMNDTQIKIETDASDRPFIGQIIDISIHDKAEYVTSVSTGTKTAPGLSLRENNKGGGLCV